MKIKGTSTVMLTSICVVLGFMIAVNLRTQKDVNFAYGMREMEMRSKFFELIDNKETLKKENKLLSQQIRLYEQKAAKGEDSVDILVDELNKARVLAGLTDVKGPGVKVEINDNKKGYNYQGDPNSNIVHDEDLLMTVNTLLAAGAEAVAVNGQRITSFSEISCAGPVILVNQTRLAPPYVITAIGDSSSLKTSLLMPGGIADNLAFWGIDVKVNTKEEVSVPAFKGNIEIEHAEYSTEEEE
ncbi:DUF881 domain-containing protein [Proteinivorax tanatarense]|uniref:DUF881 domain-containing protein n=1 Tax=Proteinivorax tanatarense TaxID=1260629 RepID=A0AAU7VPX0_9FIRM